MMRVCAWCETTLGVVPSEVFSEFSVTYGICEKCFDDAIAICTIQPEIKLSSVKFSDIYRCMQLF